MGAFQAVVATTAILLSSSSSSQDIPVYSDCTGLEDGHYLLQLSTSFPIVLANCQNGFAIIDYSTDTTWSQYFSSFNKYHYGIAGAAKTDAVNWQDWFLPDRQLSEQNINDQSSNDNDQSTSYTIGTVRKSNYNYLISSDCSVCDETDAKNSDTHGLFTAYYMNATAFGCFSHGRAKPGLDMTWDGYECRAGYDSGNKLEVMIRDEIPSDFPLHKVSMNYGVCYLETIESDFTVDNNYEQCATTTSAGAFKPSIGVDGRNCVCTRAVDNSQENSEAFFVTETFLNEKLSKIAANSQQSSDVSGQNSETSETNIVYLYQSDFLEGTYRIQNSGTYKIMEDIIFDFNAPDREAYDYLEDSPNSEGYWWPKKEQSDTYPGAADVSQAYFTGFFAGVTVECNDVVIDLNGKELSMSKEFFYSQPYWAHIELSSQIFVPGQGFGFFGSDLKAGSNVVIKNGVLGLSSHHGIHGIKAKDVVIEDVIVRDFGITGIQLNGFDGLKMDNVEVGPNAQISYLSVDYFSIRSILPRLREAAEKYSDETIIFAGKSDEIESKKVWTLSSLLDEAVEQMDMAFKHIVYNVEYDEHDEQWQSAKLNFINIDETTNKPNGIPFGGVLYGIYLNYDGSGVAGYYRVNDHSNNAQLNNIYIHDLIHSTKETLYAMADGESRLFAGPLFVPLAFKSVVGDELYNSYYDGAIKSGDWSAKYSGTIVTDIMFALYDILTNSASVMTSSKGDTINWDILGQSYIGKGAKWVKGITDFLALEPMCAGDAMIHNVKGTMGLRLSGIDNVVLQDVKIENIQEFGDVGSDKCGNYEKNHVGQQLPYQKGYTGNRVQAMAIGFSDVLMNNIEINNIVSYTGSSIAVSLWAGANVVNNEQSNVKINNIIGGVMRYGTERFLLPNSEPESCAIRVYLDEYIGNDYHDNDESGIFSNYYDSGGKIGSDDVLSASIDVSCVVGHVGCLGDHRGSMVTNVRELLNNDINFLNGDYGVISSNENEMCHVEFDQLLQFNVNDGRFDKTSGKMKNSTVMIGGVIGIIAALILVSVFGVLGVCVWMRKRGKELEFVGEDTYSIENDNNNKCEKQALLDVTKGYGAVL